MRTAWSTIGGALLLALWACAGSGGEEEPESFSTSGNREADQRAEQRMSRQDELQGAEGEEGEARPTLFQRLGGETGVETLVADFVQRALADPRVNWQRKGVRSGGFLGIGRRSVEWSPTEEDIERLGLHLAQFIAVAGGGPTRYEGRNLADVHNELAISNAEFDASIGALKASLDALEIGTDEQKELLALFESARSQVVRKR